MTARDRRLVYSTDHGRVCVRCGRPVPECACRGSSSAGREPPIPSGPVVVGRETKGRKGKGVTVVSGVPLAASELPALAKRLKQACGSGGTVKEQVIEIQGDHRDRIVQLLRERGWEVKRSGG